MRVRNRKLINRNHLKTDVYVLRKTSPLPKDFPEDGRARILIVAGSYLLLPCSLNSEVCWQLAEAYKKACPEGSGDQNAEFSVDVYDAKDLAKFITGKLVEFPSVGVETSTLVGCTLVSGVGKVYPGVGYEVFHTPFGVCRGFRTRLKRSLGLVT